LSLYNESHTKPVSRRAFNNLSDLYLDFARSTQLGNRRWVGEVSTSESWGINGYTTRCTSPVSVIKFPASCKTNCLNWGYPAIK